MTNQVIPAEAVEAAAEAAYFVITGEPYASAEEGGKERAREFATAALAAAAPHMVGPLLDDLRRERAKVELLLEGVE